MTETTTPDEAPEDTQRTCSKCRETKPTSEFYASQPGRYCKACRRQLNAEWKERNREDINARRRKQAAEAREAGRAAFLGAFTSGAHSLDKRDS